MVFKTRLISSRLAQDIIVVVLKAASMSLSVDLAVACAVGACCGAGKPACQVARRAYDVQSSGDYASMRRGGRSRTVVLSFGYNCSLLSLSCQWLNAAVRERVKMR